MTPVLQERTWDEEEESMIALICSLEEIPLRPHGKADVQEKQFKKIAC